jgi:hypothetical protein
MFPTTQKRHVSPFGSNSQGCIHLIKIIAGITNGNVRSIKKKIELPGLCYSDALIGSNHHFRLLFFLFDRTVLPIQFPRVGTFGPIF